MASSFDVRVSAKIQTNDLAEGRHSYTVRWRVAAVPFKKNFQSRTLADSDRSKLVSAARKGEAFDLETGRPVSEARTTRRMGFYEFGCKYVDMKWPRSAANSRRSIADALVAVAPVMLPEDGTKYDAKEIRNALHKWGFNTARRREAPDDVRGVLAWVERNCKPVSALSKPEVIRAALDAVASRLDGKPAASTYRARRRAVLWNLLDYGIELEELVTNPISTIKWSAPKRSGGTVDPQSVPNPTQARALLAGVGERPGSGPRMVAFFASMYFAALRPGEAVELAESNLELPKQGWGKILLDDSNPYAGRDWTDDGGDREHRQLKHREVGERRTAPCPPELTGILRKHLDEFGTDAHGRLFWAERGGGLLPAVTYQTMWKKVRESVLGHDVARTSLLAKRPYDLRHAAVSTWLASGVEPKRVADWAGHSLEVLLRVYAKVLDGQEAAALERIEATLST